MLPALIGSIECINVPCGGGQMPPNVCVSVSHPTLKMMGIKGLPLSHEVILSTPLRLRFLCINVWRHSGLLREGSTMSVERLTSVMNVQSEYPRPCPGPSEKNMQISRVHFHVMQNYLCIDSHRTTHSCYVLRETTKKVNWVKKTASGLTILLNSFQCLTSPLHHFYQTLIKYSWILQSPHC